jgi:hypothetical protein
VKEKKKIQAVMIIGLLASLLFLFSSSQVVGEQMSINKVSIVPEKDLMTPAAACTHSHSVGGFPLAECHAEVFNDKDGNSRSISVYYTLDTGADDHWIASDAQAQNVGDWGREAWLRFEMSPTTRGVIATST